MLYPVSRYIFPGLALGAALGQTGVITNAMINKSAEVGICICICLVLWQFFVILGPCWIIDWCWSEQKSNVPPECWHTRDCSPSGRQSVWAGCGGEPQDLQQGHAGGLRQGRHLRTQGLYLLRHVVSQLSAAHLSSSRQRRIISGLLLTVLYHD